LEVESRNIELFVKFGVGSEQNLKSTIKGEPVDVISAYSALKPAAVKNRLADNPASPAPTMTTSHVVGS
jgi:hypothetical protein